MQVKWCLEGSLQHLMLLLEKKKAKTKSWLFLSINFIIFQLDKFLRKETEKPHFKKSNIRNTTGIITIYITDIKRISEYYGQANKYNNVDKIGKSLQDTTQEEIKFLNIIVQNKLQEFVKRSKLLFVKTYLQQLHL